MPSAPRYSDELTWVTDGSEPEEDGLYFTDLDMSAVDAHELNILHWISGQWFCLDGSLLSGCHWVTGTPSRWAGPILPPPPPVPRRAPGYWWARRDGGPGLEVVRVDDDGTWADTAGNSWGDEARDAALWTFHSRAVPPVGVATADPE